MNCELLKTMKIKTSKLSEQVAGLKRKDSPRKEEEKIQSEVCKEV